MTRGAIFGLMHCSESGAYSITSSARRRQTFARIDADSVGIPYQEPGYLLIGATSEAWRCAF
jgi:hypothetical protein